MRLGAQGEARGTWFFTQIICLMYCCQNIMTASVNMTKGYFLKKLPTAALKTKTTWWDFFHCSWLTNTLSCPPIKWSKQVLVVNIGNLKYDICQMSDSGGEPSLVKRKVENWQRSSAAESFVVQCQERGLGWGLGGALGWGQLQLVGSEVTNRCPSQPPITGLLLFCRRSHFKLPSFHQSLTCDSGAHRKEK